MNSGVDMAKIREIKIITPSPYTTLLNFKPLCQNYKYNTEY